MAFKMLLLNLADKNITIKLIFNKVKIFNETTIFFKATKIKLPLFEVVRYR